MHETFRVHWLLPYIYLPLVWPNWRKRWTNLEAGWRLSRKSWSITAPRLTLRWLATDSCRQSRNSRHLLPTAFQISRTSSRIWRIGLVDNRNIVTHTDLPLNLNGGSFFLLIVWKGNRYLGRRSIDCPAGRSVWRFRRVPPFDSRSQTGKCSGQETERGRGKANASRRSGTCFSA